MKKSKDTAFWLNNPMVLFNKDALLDLWPSSNMSFKEKSDLYLRLERLIGHNYMGKLFKVIFAMNYKKKFTLGFN